MSGITIEELSKIFNQYTNRLPDKIDNIEILWRDLLKQWNDEKMLELHRAVHSLNGSAALYGYVELHHVAANLELKLQALSKQPEDTTTRNSIVDSMNTLRETFISSSTDNAFNHFIKLNTGIGEVK